MALGVSVPLANPVCKNCMNKELCRIGTNLATFQTQNKDLIATATSVTHKFCTLQVFSDVVSIIQMLMKINIRQSLYTFNHCCPKLAPEKTNHCFLDFRHSPSS
jgi:hypothetical protein